MRGEVEIREAGPEDYAGEKYEFVHKWLSEVSDFLYFTPSESRIEEDKARFLELLKSSRVIVAVTRDGRIVGQCSLIKLNSTRLNLLSLSLFRKMCYREEGVRGKKLNYRGRLVDVVPLGKFL